MLQTAWKDNNLVLFLSTIHDFIKLDPKLVRAQQGTYIGPELIVHNRKRSKATSTAAWAVQDEFGSATTKKLAIPRAIDEYNYRMGQVDRRINSGQGTQDYAEFDVVGGMLFGGSCTM